MSKLLSKKLGDMEYDGLIADTIPAAQVRGKTVRKLGTAATLKRGTVMGVDSVDGKLVVLGTDAQTAKQEFNGDATETVFTVTARPNKVLGVKVGGADSTDWVYDASTGKVTFGTAPASGTKNVVVTYAAGEIVADCILCDDIEVGTAADVVAEVYTAGCFNTRKIIVAEGYTMTSADFDALRKYDIVFRAASVAN